MVQKRQVSINVHLTSGGTMELYDLFKETLESLSIDNSFITPDTLSVEISLEGKQPIIMEKMPDVDLIAFTGILCRYPDKETLYPLFELLLNVHAYGVATQGCFFAANSETSQIIFHSLVTSETMTPEQLAEIARNFSASFTLWHEAYRSGEIENMLPKNQDMDVPYTTSMIRA